MIGAPAVASAALLDTRWSLSTSPVGGSQDWIRSNRSGTTDPSSSHEFGTCFVKVQDSGARGSEFATCFGQAQA